MRSLFSILTVLLMSLRLSQRRDHPVQMFGRASVGLIASSALLMGVPLTAVAHEPTPPPTHIVGRAGNGWHDRNITADEKAEADRS